MASPARSLKAVYLALGLGAGQIALALFAVRSSERDVLSDGACIGGVFGTLLNLAILAVVAIWTVVLVARSARRPEWDPTIGPLLILVLTSTLAIVIGQYAGLRCTV